MKLTELTVEQNKALIECFPFLKPRNLWTDEVPEDWSYDYLRGTYEMPQGWHRLFLLYCKHIGRVLARADYLDRFRLCEIKEKYGTLEVYNSGYPKSIEKEMEELESSYRRISKYICQVCGKVAKYQTIGWVASFCEECLLNKSFNNETDLELDIELDTFKVKRYTWQTNPLTGSLDKCVEVIDAYPYWSEYKLCLEMSNEEFFKFLIGENLYEEL